MNKEPVETLEEAINWWSSVSILPVSDFLKLVGTGINRDDDDLLLIFKYVQSFYNRGYVDGATYIANVAGFGSRLNP